jgi:cell division protein ZipA
MSFLIIGIPVLFVGIAIIFLMSHDRSTKSNRYTRGKKLKHKNTEPKIYLQPEEASHVEEELEMYDELDEPKHNESSELELELEAELEQEIEAEEETHAAAGVAPQYIVLYLLAAENQAYSGYELLQTLLTYGLRYGKNNVFHRHELKTGRGPILFSLASATESGTFDLHKMGAFSSRGLVLYMQLNDQKDPIKSFDLMLETADHLIEDLQGTVLDEQRQLLTKEKMVQLRKKIRLFLEKQKTRDLFDLPEEEVIS